MSNSIPGPSPIRDLSSSRSPWKALERSVPQRILPPRLARVQSVAGPPRRVAGAVPEAHSTSRLQANSGSGHLFLELELAQPFNQALVLDLVVPILEFHHELFFLQTTKRVFRCV
jgi:hypothetical protein